MSRTTARRRATQARTSSPATRRSGRRTHPADRHCRAAGQEPSDAPVEVKVLELMARAKQVKEIQVVNGLVAGSITEALHGERVGTIIHTG